MHGRDVLHTWKMLDVMLLNSPSTTGLTYCGLCPARVGTMPAVILIEHTLPVGQMSTGLPACMQYSTETMIKVMKYQMGYMLAN